MTRVRNIAGRGEYDPVTTVLKARNLMFTGRDDVLSDLHSKLMPSFAPSDVRDRVRCSCTIHGIGGMGKTETALEYTYRYRTCYSHIFWLAAETNAGLENIFLEIAPKINLTTEGYDKERIIKLILEWFASTCKSNRMLICGLQLKPGS